MNGKLSRSSGISVSSREQRARVRPDDGDGRPLLGHRGQPHAQLRPLGLQPLLHPVEHGRGVAGRRRAEEPLLADAHDDAVVEDHPVERAHDRVAAHADRERVERVRVHAVQELDRVGALDVDLAERRRVHLRDRLARGGALAPDGRVHVLAVPREVARPLPLADVLEDRARLDVRRVDRRDAHRVEELAAVAAREQRERDGHVRRAERRRPELARVHLQQLRGDADRVDVGELALLGAGADRRVALDVLDRAQAGADRAAHVGDGRVALEVDEHRVLVAVRQREGGRVGQALAGQPADALDPAQLAVGHGRADPVVPAQAAAGLAPEVDARAPAAGDRASRRRGGRTARRRRRA